MDIGKLGSEMLEKSIYPFLGVQRDEVLVHSGFGEDSAVLKAGGDAQVLSTDPITGADSSIGWLAVHIACNDVAASGGEPIGILVTILFPEETSEKDVEELMKEISNTAEEIDVEVIGGHTEVTPAVNKTVVSTTAIGSTESDRYVTSSGASPGDTVVMTKTAGLEGTSIIASDFEEEINSIDGKQLEEAKGMIENISVIKEGLIASRYKATAMHDVTEGGVLKASIEIAKASNTGIKLYQDKIPVEKVTKKICREFDIDPYGLMSSGTLLITTPKPDKIIKELNKKEIKASKIGKIIKDGYKIQKQKETRKLIPPERDELYKLIEKRNKED